MPKLNITQMRQNLKQAAQDVQAVHSCPACERDLNNIKDCKAHGHNRKLNP